MDGRAQVSFEYIITVSLAIVLATAVMIIALQVVSISEIAKTKIIENRASMIESVMS